MMPTGATRLAGILGWPVKHSRSPRLHGFWLDKLGIDGAYLPFAVRPADLERVLRCLAPMGIAGVNLTLPHKEAALAVMDRVDPVASRIGAVNTVIVGEDGTLEGRNTDAFGFVESVRAEQPDVAFDRGAAAVIGAGGASRAVIAALQEAGCPEIRLINRTAERAADLARSFGAPVKPVSWSSREEALGGAALVVNTTSLGMTGQPPLELALGALATDAVVCDIVYAPRQTALLRDAARRGNRTVGGLGMLLHQARPGFAAWFGVMPEVTDELRRFVEAE
jgi:shikimate dehydrogenase